MARTVCSSLRSTASCASTMMLLTPSWSMKLIISFCAPAVMESMATTAPTPKIMPSMVSRLRSLCAKRLASPIFNSGITCEKSVMAISLPPCRPWGCRRRISSRPFPSFPTCRPWDRRAPRSRPPARRAASTIMDSLCLTSCTSRGSNLPVLLLHEHRSACRSFGKPPGRGRAARRESSRPGFPRRPAGPGRSSTWTCESSSGGSGSLALLRSSSVYCETLYALDQRLQGAVAGAASGRPAAAAARRRQPPRPSPGPPPFDPAAGPRRRGLHRRARRRRVPRAPWPLVSDCGELLDQLLASRPGSRRSELA